MERRSFFGALAAAIAAPFAPRDKPGAEHQYHAEAHAASAEEMHNALDRLKQMYSTPPMSYNVTIIGADDPAAQRAMAKIIERGARAR